MGINKQLESIYSKKLKSMFSKYRGIKTKDASNIMSSPLLIKIDETKFLESDIKIMIFGQETFGWNGELGTQKLGYLTTDYLAFLNNDKEYFNGGKDAPYSHSQRRLKKKHARAFWKGFSYFEEELKNHFTNKRVYCIWNNISKIGKKDGKGITKTIQAFEKKYFSVVLDEMKILRPDIVVFMAGSKDKEIREIFSNTKFDNAGNLEIVQDKRRYKTAHRVISDDLPYKSVRLYHPSYYGGFNKIKEISLEILKR